MAYLTDIEIAQQCRMERIFRIAGNNKKAAAMREPFLGTVFGVMGGACGE